MRIYKTGYVLSSEEEKHVGYRHFANRLALLYKSRTLEDIKRSGAPYYRYIASSLDTCTSCAALHGMAFHISNAAEGVNLPPLHRNCKCDIEPYNFEDELPYDTLNPHGIPSEITPNDWTFFGWNGNEFNSEPGKIYTDTYFGKPISADDYNQTDVDMHIVDRIARLLFHEASDPKGQEAIAWVILNRLTEKNTLYDVVTQSGQFEVFQSQHNKREDQMNPYSPLEWIEEYPTIYYGVPEPIPSKKSWEYSLQLAKMLVSIACNPEIDNLDIVRDIFESWIPNPFVNEDPYSVINYVTEGQQAGNASWHQTIGNNRFYTY